MNKKLIGSIFFFIGLLIGIVPLTKNIAGYSILSSSSFLASPFYIISLAFIAMSFIILNSRTYLDAIIIPTEPSTSRIRNKARVGADAYHNSGAKVIVASGGKMPYMKPEYRHEAHIVYEELRRAGIRPAEIRVDGTSRDTLENIVHSIRMLDGAGAKDIGVVSYPAHLDRFEKIFKKAQEDGVVPKDLRIHRIETDQTLQETLWEIPARLMTKYQLRRKVNEAKTTVGFVKRAMYLMVRKFFD